MDDITVEVGAGKLNIFYKTKEKEIVWFITKCDQILADHIAACLDACRWRPIEEAPIDTVVIVCCTGEWPTTAFKNKHDLWIVVGGCGVGLVFKPTHYRLIGPLPEKDGDE